MDLCIVCKNIFFCSVHVCICSATPVPNRLWTWWQFITPRIQYTRLYAVLLTANYCSLMHVTIVLDSSAVRLSLVEFSMRTAVAIVTHSCSTWSGWNVHWIVTIQYSYCICIQCILCTRYMKLCTSIGNAQLTQHPVIVSCLVWGTEPTPAQRTGHTINCLCKTPVSVISVCTVLYSFHAQYLVHVQLYVPVVASKHICRQSSLLITEGHF